MGVSRHLNFRGASRFERFLRSQPYDEKVGLEKPVFISYARRTSRKAALALHAELGGDDGEAFLDTADIELGTRFPLAIVDAILACRVAVVFADDTYLTRWYCLRELRTLLSAFASLVAGQAPTADREEALTPVVLALGTPPPNLDAWPAVVRDESWPSACETARLASLLHIRLAAVTRTVGERLEGLGLREQVRTTLLEEAAIPPPLSLQACRHWSLPGELPPSLGDEFVGRADELWQIHHRLTTKRGGQDMAPPTCAVEGGGGFGKTRLAAEYVHRFGPRHHRGGLFWVNADLASRRDEQLHGILATLRPGTPSLRAFLESERDLSDELRKAIETDPAEQPILYVVDNIPEPDRAEPGPSLEMWCPAIGQVALLVTSRASQSLVGGVARISVDALPQHAARLLLTHGDDRVGRLPDTDWDAIARWVGNLPLALVLLNASLRARVIRPEALLRAVKSGHGSVEQLDSSAASLAAVVPPGSLRGVTEALAISYERMPASAQQAARVLAHLSTAPIPEAILDELPDDLTAGPVRALLTTRSFVNPVREDDDVPMFGRMHPVLADFLRTRSDNPLAELRVLGPAFIRLFDQVRNTAMWSVLNASLPHAFALYDDLSASLDLDLVDIGVALGGNVGRLLTHQGYVQLAVGVDEANAAVAMNALGFDNLGTQNVLGNLATTLHLVGRLDEARDLDERLLEYRTRVLGDEDPHTLTALNRLATTIGAQGDIVTARAYKQRAAEIWRRIRGPEDPSTLMVNADLAELAREDGDFAEAKAVGKQVLDAQLRALGGDHPATIRSMNNLAATLRALNELEDALKLGADAVARQRRIAGDHHPSTLRYANNLAETLRALGQVAEASEIQEYVLAIQSNRLGTQHPETVRTIEQLALTRRAAGNTAGAEKLEQMVQAAGPGRRRLAELA